MNHSPSAIPLSVPFRCWAVFLSLLAVVPAARSDEMYIRAVQSGGEVVFSFDGSIDLAGFPGFESDNFRAPSQISPSVGTFLNLAAATGFYQVYTNVIPESPSRIFGAGGTTASSSSTGVDFGIVGNQMALPSGYASGTGISGTVTFHGATFSSLGVDPTPKSFNTSVGTNTIFLAFTVVDNSAAEAELRQKIQKLEKKSKKLKAKGKAAKAKKLLKTAKKLKAQLAALG